MKDYIGREFTSKDGYKCKIIRDIDEKTNIIPSQRRYEVRFEDSTLAIYNYQTLRRGDFSKSNIINYIGQEFTSSDGYKCKVIRDLNWNTDIVPCKRTYEVEFKDGTLATYHYDTLRNGEFKKSSIINIIGKEFTSSDGYKCKVVKDLDESLNMNLSQRRYEVQFEDGTLATYIYRTLKRGEFRKSNLINYIGQEFTSRDGYKCKIIRDLDENTDIVSCKRTYEVEFKDGTLATYSYVTLKSGRFKKSKIIKYIGKEFTSKDGYKCKIVRDLEKDTDKKPSARLYEVEFEDGILATHTYPTLRDSKFKKPKYFTERIDKETGYKLNECALCKLALIMPLDTRVLHLRIHHGINVDKDSELL